MTQTRHAVELLDLILTAGALTVRAARMEPGKRYKIDVGDESHPVVYLNASLEPDAVRGVMLDVLAVLADYWRVRASTPVDPHLELVDELTPAEAATGTDGVSEHVAAAARGRFGVVR